MHMQKRVTPRFHTTDFSFSLLNSGAKSGVGSLSIYSIIRGKLESRARRLVGWTFRAWFWRILGTISLMKE